MRSSGFKGRLCGLGFVVYRSGFGFFPTWLVKFSGLLVSPVGSVHVHFGSIWVTADMTLFGNGWVVGSGLQWTR